MTEDERVTMFKEGLKKLVTECGVDLKPVVHTEDMGTGKILLRTQIELLFIDDWESPAKDEIED